jgi:AcrR family transcriptional regulator
MTRTSHATTEPRYLPSEVRRQQILDAAAQLAMADGLEETSIAKVAEAAGVAKGSIYLHFRSRQELVAGLQGQVWSQMMETPRRLAGDEESTWAERLDAVVEHWMRYEFEHHRLYHAVFHAVATDSEEPWEAARILLGELIAGGAAAGEFDITDLDLGVTVEFLLHAYAGPCYAVDDVDSAIGDVQRLFRRTVGATSGVPAALGEQPRPLPPSSTKRAATTKLETASAAPEGPSTA